MSKKPTYEKLEERIKELEQSKSEHKLTYIKPFEKENLFRIVMDQSPLAIEIYDLNGRLLIVNDAWESFWNMKKSDIVNFNILNDPECERTGLTSAFKKTLQGIAWPIPPTKYDPEKSGFSHGLIRWISSRMYPIKDQHGNIKKIVLLTEDISERKQAEEALKKVHNELESKVKERTIKLNNELQQHKQTQKILQENEKKYRLLFETVIHGIQEIDISGKIVSANSACHMMLGYEKGELKGRSMFEFIANSNQRKALHDNIQTLIQQQLKPKPWFGKIKKKNGDVFDGQTDWNYKLNMHGEVISFILVLSDITERKQIEAEHEKTIKESLKREKLQGVLEMTGAVCHELNQPLMVLSGYAELLLQDIPENEQACKKIKTIFDQSRRIANITKKLMKITQYKTKDYLKGKIIDIDAASDENKINTL